MAEQKTNERMEALVSLCKRRGFIFPASEIYGGINGFWDYGPMGVELKRNIKAAWWHDLVHSPPLGPDGQEISMVGIDTAIIQNPRVWEASGHVGTFADMSRKCSHCGHFVRADQLWDILAQSTWVDSLLQVFTPVTGEYDSERLMKWARGKGKRHAPNLALVRNPEVTLTWIATRVEGQPEARLNIREILQYLATEQLNATGLQDPCPQCGGELDEPKPFTLMFESHAGLVKDDDHKVYLRPETAQGIFVNYKNVLDTSRVKLPFGIAQVGKAFRNEITPRNYTFRSREFEQMEIEFFCHPDESRKWYEFWRDQRINWYKTLGLASDHLRPREQGDDELAHYSSACTDIEYLFPFSEETQELEGVAHRGDYDLSRHQKFSGKGMEYIDDQTKERFIPHVIEPSAGVDRFTLAVLCEAFQEDEAPNDKGEMQKRTVMRFHPRLAPIKVAVFPLVRKDGMPEIATDLYRRLRKRWVADYDEKSAVGRRYRRHDEIGTPFCVTVDGQTKEDDTVTVRDRDSMEQTRVKLDELEAWLQERLGNA